jgi:hypothetical protein
MSDSFEKENNPAEPTSLEELTLDDPAAAAAYAASKKEREAAAPRSTAPSLTAAAKVNLEKVLENFPTPEEISENTPRKAVIQKTKLDKVGFILGMVLLPIVLLATGFTLLSGPKGPPEKEIPRKPNLPMEGATISIKEITTGWVPREQGDRVATETEPVSNRTVSPSQLATLRFKGTAKGTGYVRVLFYDGAGEIAGDPRLIKVEGGQLKQANPNSTAEKFPAPGECHIRSSAGFLGLHRLQEYFAAGKKPWYVEVSESASYQAKGDEWKILGTFQLGCEILE